MWFRRLEGAVRVVDSQCWLGEVVQFLLARVVNPFLNSVNVVFHSKALVGRGKRRVVFGD